MRKQQPLPAPRCCRFDLHTTVKPPTAPAQNSRSNRLYCIRTCPICRRLCLYHTDCAAPFFVAAFNPLLRAEVRLLGSLVQDFVRALGDKRVAQAFADLFPPIIERVDGAYREQRRRVMERLGLLGREGAYHLPKAPAAPVRPTAPAQP